MKNQQKSQPVEAFIDANTEYFRLDKAAQLLGCDLTDLLHLGVHYKLQILAPVLAEGMYTWDIDPAVSGYPEIVGKVTNYFDASERVLLSWIDLAKIEAVGWAIPTHFYAPAKAQDVDEFLTQHLLANSKDSEIDGKFTLTKNEGGKEIFSVSYCPSEMTEFNEEATKLRKKHYYAPWFIDTLPSDAERTTANHLFLSKTEFERIKSKQPSQFSMPMAKDRMQLEKKEHGLVEHNAKKRQEVLMAAIYCKSRFFPDQPLSLRKWAETIDEKATLFWKETGRPPLERDSIERLLGNAEQYGRTPEPNNTKHVK